jgi:peptidoglycan/xylan/chitin deacetylase (PgdA/CDA1 family)
MVPHKIPRWFRQLFPGFTWKRPAGEGLEVYLTFDDGPIPEVTEFVLDQLAAHGAQATFFCVGDNARRHPQVLARVRAGGHRAANHTFNHLSGWSTGRQPYLANVALCQAQLLAGDGQSLVGSQGKPLFRPPYGRIGPGQAQVLRQTYEIVMWDVLSGDYERAIGPENCLRNTLRATESGSVVVFHDSRKAYPNLRYVLPRYLEALSARGATFRCL